MVRKHWVVLAIAAVLALGYAGFKEFRYSDPAECYACRRPIHAHSRTVAMVNGRARLFCCPACAFSLHEQGKESVRITQLASFDTGAVLSPGAAFIVKGSDVNMCARERARVDVDKQPATLQYDRCAPSMYAFPSKELAEAFAREHGGEVLPFKQLEAVFVK